MIAFSTNDLASSVNLCATEFIVEASFVQDLNAIKADSGLPEGAMSTCTQTPIGEGEEGAVRASLRLLGVAELSDQEIYRKLASIVNPK